MNNTLKILSFCFLTNVSIYTYNNIEQYDQTSIDIIKDTKDTSSEFTEFDSENKKPTTSDLIIFNDAYLGIKTGINNFIFYSKVLINNSLILVQNYREQERQSQLKCKLFDKIVKKQATYDKIALDKGSDSPEAEQAKEKVLKAIQKSQSKIIVKTEG